ncbi:MAG: hypothetical protein ACE5I5_05925 [Candidatus Heimdallarchaeota archaeon]
MISDARKKFFIIMGENYEKFGYPSLGGWIEALFMLELGYWTQENISKRLTELLPETDHPTSRASVNRAIKLLEIYGVIVKSGSRKLGYRYRLAPSANMIINMFQQFILNNESFIKELSFIKEQYNLDNDQTLKKVVDTQIEGYTLFNQILKKVIESFILEKGELESSPTGDE